MFMECKGFDDWVNCLDCKYLSTQFCPLEGENSIDRIVSRIKMIESVRSKRVKRLKTSKKNNKDMRRSI